MPRGSKRTTKKARLSTFVADLTIIDSKDTRGHGRHLAGMDTSTGAVSGSAAVHAKTGSERVQTVVRRTTDTSTSTVTISGSISEFTKTWSKDAPGKVRQEAEPARPLAHERTTDTDRSFPSRGQPTDDRPSDVLRKRLRETGSDGEPEEPGKQSMFPMTVEEDNWSEKGAVREVGLEDITNRFGDSKVRAQNAWGAGAIPERPKNQKGDDRPNLNFFDVSLCDIFRHNRYRQRSRDNDFLEEISRAEHPDAVRLSVGCEIIAIENDVHDLVRYTVYDFRRGVIVVDWREGLFGSITTGTRTIWISVEQPNGTEQTTLVGPDPWVRRDPNLSRKLVQEKWEEYQRQLQENGHPVAVDHTPPLLGLHEYIPFQRRETSPIEVIGDGSEDDYPLCRLSEVPIRFMPQYGTDFCDESTGDVVEQCPFCFETVERLPGAFTSWWDIPREPQKYQSYSTHCADKHRNQCLWQLEYKERNHAAKEPYTIRDHVQWALRYALEEHLFPRNFVLLLVKGETTQPFRCHLMKLFGFANALIRRNVNFTRKGCDLPPGLSSQTFRDEAVGVLQEIAKRFEKFDFRTLASLTHELRYHRPRNQMEVAFDLWNSIHLFFMRGLYMEPPFPPLLSMQVHRNDNVPFQQMVDSGEDLPPGGSGTEIVGKRGRSTSNSRSASTSEKPKRPRGKNLRSREEKRERMFGNTLNPYAGPIMVALTNYRYRERRSDEAEVDNPGPSIPADTLFVGQTVSVVDNQGTNHHEAIIYDFRRGRIVISWVEGPDSFSNLVDPRTSRVFGEVQEGVEVNFGRDPWVIRDPKLSREMVADMTAQYNNKIDSLRATMPNDPSIDFSNLLVASIPIKILGDGPKEDNICCRLSEVPQGEMEGTLEAFNETTSSHAARSCCPFCFKIVPKPRSFNFINWRDHAEILGAYVCTSDTILLCYFHLL